MTAAGDYAFGLVAFIALCVALLLEKVGIIEPREDPPAYRRRVGR